MTSPVLFSDTTEEHPEGWPGNAAEIYEAVAAEDLRLALGMDDAVRESWPTA